MQPTDPPNRQPFDNGLLALIVGAGSMLLSAALIASLWFDYANSPRVPGDAMAYPLGGCILASFGLPAVGLTLCALWRLRQRSPATEGLRAFALLTGVGLATAIPAGMTAPMIDMPEVVGRVVRAIPFFLLLANVALLVRLYFSDSARPK